MSKEKVFIVLSHKHNLKPGSKTEWEVSEKVEFVNQLRKKHITMSSAIGDFLNRKMISGSKVGLVDYDYFEEYLEKKYSKEMEQLKEAYGHLAQVRVTAPEPFIDMFGNEREKTVFDAN